MVHRYSPHPSVPLPHLADFITYSMPYFVQVSTAVGFVAAVVTCSSSAAGVSKAFITAPPRSRPSHVAVNDHNLMFRSRCETSITDVSHRYNPPKSLQLRQQSMIGSDRAAEACVQRISHSRTTLLQLSAMRNSLGDDGPEVVYRRRAAGYGCKSFRGGVQQSRQRCRMSSPEGEGIANPLSRDDAERAGINKLISYLAETEVEQWQPSMLEEQLPTLMKGVLYKQTMAERKAKAKGNEEQNQLTQVDAFLSGYLKQEKRKVSRKKVSAMLSAATGGVEELDDLMKKMAAAGQLDADLKEFLKSAVETEVNKGKTVKTSELLKVLKAMQTRVEAEEAVRDSPDIRTLAQVMQIEDPAKRKTFLQGAFARLEDLDNFVNRLDACMEYIGSEFNFSVRTNMPLAKLDQLKEIHQETTELRSRFLQ